MRDALARVTGTPEEARNLHEAARDVLRGRGRARREAQAYILEASKDAPSRVIPLLLAVRDELAREASPPRGLSGRVDALLLALAERGAEVGTAGPREARSSPQRKAKRRRRSAPARPGSAAPADRTGRVLRRILELVPDAVLTIRASGRVGLWNRAGVGMTGRQRRALSRNGIQALFPRPEVFDALREELEARRTLEPREVALVNAAGEEVPVRVLGAVLDPLSGGRRDPERFLLVFHDLTEVHRIRRRLIETEKLSAMAKIAGSVAHEFRNPLNSLFLSADLLEDELSGRGGVETAIAPTLAAIREEVERLNQIITHYLSLSKVESSTPEIVDLGELVEGFAEEWHDRVARRGVELRVRVAKGDLEASADPNQLRRVLVNLVENALDALTEEAETAEEEGASRGHVLTLGVRPMRRAVKITVRDNGPGIPDDVRERVFEPFYTSKSRGSGLGLYLVREIVLAHAGAISLAGNGGRGTAVVTHWPRPAGDAS